MLYDLKKLRRRLGIKVPEIVEKFNLHNRQIVYYWERKKQYPEYVKEWMDKKEDDMKAFNNKASLRAIDERLKRLEKKIGGSDVSTTEK